ncbi:hypothetical protein VTO42DRAFT_6821 [Malbranchea cinnamomea]
MQESKQRLLPARQNVDIRCMFPSPRACCWGYTPNSLADCIACPFACPFSVYLQFSAFNRNRRQAGRSISSFILLEHCRPIFFSLRPCMHGGSYFPTLFDDRHDTGRLWPPDRLDNGMIILLAAL